MLSKVDKNNQKPGLMMGNIYYALLSKILKNNPEKLLSNRIKLSNSKKFLIALLTFFNYNWIS